MWLRVLDVGGMRGASRSPGVRERLQGSGRSEVGRGARQLLSSSPAPSASSSAPPFGGNSGSMLPKRENV